MALELVATGRDPSAVARHELHEGIRLRIGRAPREGLVIPWDLGVSREHADVTLEGETATVRCLATARNPLEFSGRQCRVARLAPGTSLRIGNTRLSLERVAVVPQPFDEIVEQEFQFSREELRTARFAQPEERLELLSKLPEWLLGITGDQDVAELIVRFVLYAVARADAVALVQTVHLPDQERAVQILKWTSRDRNLVHFRPSRRLVLTTSETDKGILHIWDKSAAAAEPIRYTASDNLDWAYCQPVHGTHAEGWFLYLAGRMSPLDSRESMQGDLRFVELLGTFLSAIRHIRMLETRTIELSRYFSPAVVESLKSDDATAILAPRVGQLSVLFCDLRDFSKVVEAESDLLVLLDRVRSALGIMTSAILREEGVVSDFQGDAALGFWGWPAPLSEGALPACRAALSIRETFASAGHPEHADGGGFRVGIGMAHGQAVAGRIGTEEQSKVGVFGRVVNLAARLEGMTRKLETDILMDSATADSVRSSLSGLGRIRSLGRFIPCGLTAPVAVFDLLPPAGDSGAQADSDLVRFEAALRLFSAGDWKAAREVFQPLSAIDGPSRFFLTFIDLAGGNAPKDWSGVVRLLSK